MQLVKVPVYQCEFCTKISISKGGIARHEKTCRHSPSVRPRCWSCKHFVNDFFAEPEDVEYVKFVDYEGEEQYGCVTMQQQKCKATNCKMFARFAIRNENLRVQLEDNGYIPCPTETEKCENYEGI